MCLPQNVECRGGSYGQQAGRAEAEETRTWKEGQEVNTMGDLIRRVHIEHSGKLRHQRNSKAAAARV